MTKNEKRAAKILAGLFILLVIFIVSVAVYLYFRYRYLDNLYTELQVQKLMLREFNDKAESEDLEAKMAESEAKIAELEAFNNKLLRPVSDEAYFMDEITKVLISNDIEIISSDVYSPQDQRFIANLDLNVKCKHANIKNFLYDLRKLPFNVRIASFDTEYSDNLMQDEAGITLQMQALLE